MISNFNKYARNIFTCIYYHLPQISRYHRNIYYFSLHFPYSGFPYSAYASYHLEKTFPHCPFILVWHALSRLSSFDVQMLGTELQTWCNLSLDAQGTSSTFEDPFSAWMHACVMLSH
ncbi:hypothetical protein RJT34_19942 [Clitoria ternatea]|uniref:Uncharacterized protein n=1 Tax=Clitoria ternatea TaxID=43366 RepID=A0AAN9ISA4_CLITE